MMRRLLILFLLITYATNAKEAEFSLRIIGGLFTYDSNAVAGKTSTLGSPSIQYHFHVENNLRIGVNYEVHFDVKTQKTSLYGVGISTKYDFFSSSNTSLISNKYFSLSSIPRWKSYFLFLINRYNYYLGKNKAEESRFEQNGNFINIDSGVGLSYSINKNYQTFIEASTTLSSFAGSDDRIKLKSNLLSIGFTKGF